MTGEQADEAGENTDSLPLDPSGDDKGPRKGADLRDATVEWDESGMVEWDRRVRRSSGTVELDGREREKSEI